MKDCTNLEMARILSNWLEKDRKVCQVPELTTLQCCFSSDKTCNKLLSLCLRKKPRTLVHEKGPTVLLSPAMKIN